MSKQSDEPMHTLGDLLAEKATPEWRASKRDTECESCEHAAAAHLLGRACLLCPCKRFRNDKAPLS